MHNITKFVLTVTAFLGCIVLYTAMHTPGVGPLMCPWCFGFQRLEPGLYIEKTASETARQQTQATLHESKRTVERYFGPLQSDPAIFVCVTEDCYVRVERRGGHTLAISFLDWVVLLSPRTNAEVALTHELSHTELHTRLGPQMFEVPIWFDEGLAVNVSDDSRYLAPEGSTTRCTVPPPKVLPMNGATWISATEETTTPYAQAACLVSIWLERQPNGSAVLKLVSDVKAGVPFSQAIRS